MCISLAGGIPEWIDLGCDAFNWIVEARATLQRMPSEVHGVADKGKELLNKLQEARERRLQIRDEPKLDPEKLAGILSQERDGFITLIKVEIQLAKKFDKSIPGWRNGVPTYKDKAKWVLWRQKIAEKLIEEMRDRLASLKDQLDQSQRLKA